MGREYSIGQLLNSSTGKVKVPRHQRPYSWEASELRELWQDITAFSDKYPGNLINGRQYFLGSIVGQVNTKSKFIEILDGQQRLATLTILLAGIRDVLHEDGRPLEALKIHMNSIVAATDSLDAPDDYILQLGKSDDLYFRQVVLAYPPENQKSVLAKTASQAAILRAKNFFRAQIEERVNAVGSSRFDVANRLYAIINSNLIVVRVASESWDDVTDIFERLNDRGKGLSTLDLLRVYLIGKTQGDAQADVEEAWGSVYELSQSATKVDAFLRHSWITYRGDVKSRSLYKEIKSVLDKGDQPSPLDSSVTFSQSLAADAELYAALLEAKHPDDRCAYWLRAISTLGATSLLPVALAGSARAANPDEYAVLLERVVTTFVRWNVITGGESTELEEAVFGLAQEVRNGGVIEDITKALLRPYLRDDDTVINGFQTIIVKRAGYQRYLLEALEDKMAHPGADLPVEKPIAGAGTIWIEHIYPQRPGKQWPRWEKHEEYLNRLGNLTLIHKRLNNSAKNKELSDKKAYYAESKLALNKYFAGLASWSPAEIEKRQEGLAKLATTIWKTF